MKGKKTVFIVDDSNTNLMAAKKALEGTYKTYALPSASRMFKLLERIIPDLILLDVDMTVTDGFEAMRILKDSEQLRAIPVIFLTAMHDAELEIRGFEMGALDFIFKPFSSPVLIRRIENHIETDRMIKESQQNLRDLYDATISVIADMVECRDKITGGHIERTQTYLNILIGELLRTGTYAGEIDGWDIKLLLPSAQLHDLGKIAVSDTILNKPAKLTADEFDIMKEHSAEGERIIQRIIEKTKNMVYLVHAKKFAGYHHERWDGAGYPRGVSGTDIPLEGRLMAIVDVYDALVSERPYKRPYSHEKAVEIISGDSGSHFDPVLVEMFMNVAEDFWAEATITAKEGNGNEE